jgi:lantibiotic modifying enzyme
MNRHEDELLQRIARYLMLHGSFCNDAGLLHGKTGIAVFFYHYARHTGKKIYSDFAGKLIDEIYGEIHSGFPLNFESGLCGVGWGIAYLIRNRFVNADPDEVLEDLDRRITEWDVRRITDCSLETGLKGIAAYVISRQENRENGNSFFTKEYIEDLITALCRNGEKDIDKERYIIDLKEKRNRINPVFDIVEKMKYTRESVFEKTRSIGICNNGYAGIGLHLMKIYRP